jgi:UMF1 family MFS transporter
MGLALGGIGASSRAFVGMLTPVHKTAEFFGLWGLAYKLAGVVGVLLFGVVMTLSPTLAYSLLTLVFVAGAVLLTRVREDEGVRAARAAETAHAHETDRADAAAMARTGPPTGTVEPGTGPTPGGTPRVPD